MLKLPFFSQSYYDHILIKNNIFFNLRAKMDAELKKRANTKIFLGVPLIPEIYTNLNHSKLWKDAQITPGEDDLAIVHHEGKDFIGLYAAEEKISFKDLRELEGKMKSKLKEYCAQLDLSSQQITIFSQVFIA